MSPTIDARSLLATLRPQPFGTASSRDVSDPIVEPLWAGIRVLAAVDSRRAQLVDEESEPIEDQERIVTALALASRANGIVLDGYLTKQVRHEQGVGGSSAPPLEDVPTAGLSVTRLLFGNRRNREAERTAEMKAAREARTFGPDDTVTFVATDLLWLDGESLLDIPLLERKRLLESVIEESEVVRCGLYVRPPVEPLIASWRAQGFGGLTFKAANSRYSPGIPTRDWASGA